MQPLSVNLAIIFGTKLTVTNLIDFLYPWVCYKMKKAEETKGVNTEELTVAERDYLLMPYNSMLDGIYLYADRAVEFGFMILFVVALPISPLLSLVNCYIKLKFQMWKQLSVRHKIIFSL